MVNVFNSFSAMKDSVTVKIMADGVISVSSVVIRIDMNSDDEFKDLFISWNDEVILFDLCFFFS